MRVLERVIARVVWWAYLRLIRSWLSPLTYWVVRLTRHRGPLPDRWSRLKNATENGFASALAQMPYRWDPFGGLLDYSPEEPDFFFVEREQGRDCDDWARMWFWWAQEQGYRAWEIFIVDGLKVRSAHAITVFMDEGGEYVLCNYKIEGRYRSMAGALKRFRVSRETSYGTYDNLLWFVMMFGEETESDEWR